MCVALSLQTGIHVVPISHPDVTHHLTASYALTPIIATSLISVATLVKPEWLSAIIAAGSPAEEGELSTLEERYDIPSTRKYRPTFSPSLPPSMKKYDVWEPNEGRPGLFRQMRFIFVGEKGTEAQGALKELVRRAEGEYECFGVEKGGEGFRQVLSKGRARGSKLALVAATEGTVAAIGKDGWKTLLSVAAR